MTRQCRWKKQHPEKNRAHSAVYRAVCPPLPKGKGGFTRRRKKEKIMRIKLKEDIMSEAEYHTKNTNNKK